MSKRNMPHVIGVILLFLAVSLAFGLSAREKRIVLKVDYQDQVLSNPAKSATGWGCDLIDYSCNVAFVWPMPDPYGDSFFNLRFTTPRDACTLTTACVAFDILPTIPGNGVDIYVWDDDGLGFPAAIRAVVHVDDVDMVYYNDFQQYTCVDLRPFGIIYNMGDEFHIGWNTTDPINNVYAGLSDDGSCGDMRSSFYWGGGWYTIYGDWGIDVNFLISAELCYPEAAGPDLVVHSPYVNPLATQPGNEVEIGFIIENIGTDSTIADGILNFIFTWDSENGDIGEQLETTSESCLSHVYHRLQPGEFDTVAVIVEIPPDWPIDTVIRMAVVTDLPDVEAELDETNNIDTFDIEIIAFGLSELGPLGVFITDNIEMGGYGDVYQFDMPIKSQGGNAIFAEVKAQRIGSPLDPCLQLFGPDPESLLTGEGAFQEIGLDSRLINPDLPGPGPYRLRVWGAPPEFVKSGEEGFYELVVQEAVFEAEPNDDPTIATPYAIGTVMIGYLATPGDIDYYSFSGSLGDILEIDVDADEAFQTVPDSTLDPKIMLLNTAGDILNMDDDSHQFDPYLFLVLPATDTYFLTVEDSPGGGEGYGYPEYVYSFKITQHFDMAIPDLSPMNLALVSDTVPVGGNAQISFETWNLGGMTTLAGGVSIDLRLSIDEIIDDTDTLLTVGDFEGDIDPGNFTAAAASVGIPADMPLGSYYLGVILDPTEDEVESNEGNNIAYLPIELIEQAYICGDANGDGGINVGDAVFVISYVFKGGPPPDPVCAGDANGDGGTNVGDAVYLIAFVFKGGPAPVEDCCPW